MSDPREIRLSDGRIATLRPASVSDAASSIELDHALIADGRGLVITEDQVRTLDQESRRIDQMYAAWSAGDASMIAVAEIQGSSGIVGSAALQQLGPSRCRHVGVVSLGVHPQAQRLGIGRALMTYLVDRARAFDLVRLELCVRADNDRAQALYRSLGFRHEGTRERFVRLEDGAYVDDLIFALFLGDEIRGRGLGELQAETQEIEPPRRQGGPPSSEMAPPRLPTHPEVRARV